MLISSFPSFSSLVLVFVILILVRRMFEPEFKKNYCLLLLNLPNLKINHLCQKIRIHYWFFMCCHLYLIILFNLCKIHIVLLMLSSSILLFFIVHFFPFFHIIILLNLQFKLSILKLFKLNFQLPHSIIQECFILILDFVQLLNSTHKYNLDIIIFNILT